MDAVETALNGFKVTILDPTPIKTVNTLPEKTVKNLIV
jgi:hypothetical protein